MNEAEFRERVYAAVPPDSGLKDPNNSFVEWAIMDRKKAIKDHLQTFSGFNLSDVAEVVENAAKHKSRYLSLSPSGGTLDRSRILTTDEIISSQALFDLLQPWRDFLREAGFGSTAAPFTNLEEAAKWVESTAKAEMQAFFQRYGDDDLKAVDSDLFTVGERVRSMGFYLELKPPLLRYIAPDGHVTRVLALSGSPKTYLWRLADRLSFLEAVTLVPQPLLTAWVLTDADPVVPLVSLERQVGRLPQDLLKPTWGLVEVATRGRARFVPSLEATRDAGPHAAPGFPANLPEGVEQRMLVLTVHHGALKDKDLRRVNAEIQAFFGRKHGKPITPGHAEVWRLVRDRGGPPKEAAPGQVKRFFEEICSEYNENHPDRESGRFASWKSAWKAYKDVLKRVQVLLAQHPKSKEEV